MLIYSVIYSSLDSQIGILLYFVATVVCVVNAASFFWELLCPFDLPPSLQMFILGTPLPSGMPTHSKFTLSSSFSSPRINQFSKNSLVSWSEVLY